MVVCNEANCLPQGADIHHVLLSAVYNGCPIVSESDTKHTNDLHHKTISYNYFAGGINGFLHSQVCVSGAFSIQVLVEPGFVVQEGDYTDQAAHLPLMKASLDRQV